MTRQSWKPKPLKLDVKPARSGMGDGLFAGEAIAEDTSIVEYVGPTISKEETYTSTSRYLFEISSRKTIDGAVDWNLARWINHSCDPNCEPEIHRGRVYIIALRDIEPGEELGYDYGERYFDEYLKGKCLCDACVREREAKRVAAE